MEREVHSGGFDPRDETLSHRGTYRRVNTLLGVFPRESLPWVPKGLCLMMTMRERRMSDGEGEGEGDGLGWLVELGAGGWQPLVQLKEKIRWT